MKLKAKEIFVELNLRSFTKCSLSDLTFNPVHSKRHPFLNA